MSRANGSDVLSVFAKPDERALEMLTKELIAIVVCGDATQHCAVRVDLIPTQPTRAARKRKIETEPTLVLKNRGDVSEELFAQMESADLNNDEALDACDFAENFESGAVTIDAIARAGPLPSMITEPCDEIIRELSFVIRDRPCYKSSRSLMVVLLTLASLTSVILLN